MVVVEVADGQEEERQVQEEDGQEQDERGSKCSDQNQCREDEPALRLSCEPRSSGYEISPGVEHLRSRRNPSS